MVVSIAPARRLRTALKNFSGNECRLPYPSAQARRTHRLHNARRCRRLRALALRAKANAAADPCRCGWVSFVLASRILSCIISKTGFKSRSRGQNLNINPDRAPRRCSRSLPPAPRGRPLSPAFAFLTPSQGFVATRGMSGERRSRRGGGSAPPTDEEDEIQKLQAERLAAAAAGPSQQSGGEKYAGYARELADEEPEEDEPVRYVWRVCRVNPITALVAIGRPCPAIVVAKLVRRRGTFRVFDSSDTLRSRAPPARLLHTEAYPSPRLTLPATLAVAYPSPPPSTLAQPDTLHEPPSTSVP